VAPLPSTYRVFVCKITRVYTPHGILWDAFRRLDFVSVVPSSIRCLFWLRPSYVVVWFGLGRHRKPNGFPFPPPLVSLVRQSKHFQTFSWQDHRPGYSQEMAQQNKTIWLAGETTGLDFPSLPRWLHCSCSFTRIVACVFSFAVEIQLFL